MTQDKNILDILRSLEERIDILEKGEIRNITVPADGKLVLPEYASDPGTVTNGMIFYNTSTNKARVGENGAWRNF